MTRGVVLAFFLAAGMAVAILGSLCTTRPAATGLWLRRILPRVPSDPSLELIGALAAVLGILVTLLAVISEIWWRQGVKLP
jgi:hypothetical protein